MGCFIGDVMWYNFTCAALRQNHVSLLWYAAASRCISARWVQVSGDVSSLGYKRYCRCDLFCKRTKIHLMLLSHLGGDLVCFFSVLHLHEDIQAVNHLPGSSFSNRPNGSSRCIFVCLYFFMSPLSSHHLSPPRSTPRTLPCCRTCWRWSDRSPFCMPHTDPWWGQRPRWAGGLGRIGAPRAGGTWLGRQNRGVLIFCVIPGVVKKNKKNKRNCMWSGELIRCCTSAQARPW